MEDKIKFNNELKERLFPQLRKLSFKGSGQNFRRINGNIINTINIQGDKYGKGCYVNLGLHLDFLPYGWNNELPDLKNIKEVDCEFRERLTPANKNDYMWKYNPVLSSPVKSAHHLINTYIQIGESLFKKYDSIEKIIDAVTISELEKQLNQSPFISSTPCRGALTMARIHNHIGNRTQAKKFAEYGITNLGNATALLEDFKKILKDD